MVKALLNKRIVGYCRVSCEAQIENTSISFQTEKIKEYCKLYGAELVKVFTDNAKTGSRVEVRDEYIEMMEYIKDPNNAIGAVICYKSDRIHRKLKNLLEMIEELEGLNVAFKSISESFDTSTCQGMLFLQMIGSFSEFEKTLINERCKAGRVKKASCKKYAGGRLPYGYRLVDGDKIEINDTEAAVIRWIFKAKVEGESLQDITDALNEKGVKNCSNGIWNRQSVRYILRNKMYVGQYSYNGDKEGNGVNFKVSRIVSKQLFRKANGGMDI